MAGECDAVLALTVTVERLCGICVGRPPLKDLLQFEFGSNMWLCVRMRTGRARGRVLRGQIAEVI